MKNISKSAAFGMVLILVAIGAIAAIGTIALAVPEVTITGPAPGNVTGTVQIQANVTESENISRVDFYYANASGTTLIDSAFASPLLVNWNTSSISPGNYQLTAVAISLENESINHTSPPVQVTVVAAPAPNITPNITPNVTAPQIISTNPANGTTASNVSAITVKFNKPVVISAGNVNLTHDTVADVVSTISNNETNETNITPVSGFVAGMRYTITLSNVSDAEGNAVPQKTWSFTIANATNITTVPSPSLTNYSISLTRGWNLISLPVTPLSTKIEDVLGSEISNINAVWTYDAPTAIWSAFIPNVTGGNLTDMVAGKGYWIDYNNSSGNITGAGSLFFEGLHTPPETTLVPGWNLIGYYQRENTTTVSAKCAFKTLGDPDNLASQWWVLIMGHDNHNKQFTPLGSGAQMQPGMGFWIEMSSKLPQYKYGPGLSASECA